MDVFRKLVVKLHRTELPQHHVCKEEEVLTDQQLWNQERNSSLDQEDPEPPQIKEEQGEPCISQEGEQLVLKQETDTFMVTPTYEENDHQFLSNNSDVYQRQDQKGGKPGDSGSTGDAEPKPEERLHKDESHSDNANTSKSSEIHCKTHTGQKSFKCDTCVKTFKYKQDLNKHVRVHTGEKPYSCDVCGKRFAQTWMLKGHITIHTGESLKCEICGKTFNLKCNLNRHLRVHTGEKPYSCDTCGKRFAQMSSVKCHIVTTHIGVVPYNTHTGEKSFKCDTCGKTFLYESKLNTHMRSHTGEKPHSCDTCGKRFPYLQTLQDHLRIHTGERPYSCEICGQDFRFNSALSRHMKTHISEKPHLCNTCGKTFIEIAKLKRHINRAHAVKEGGKSA